MSSLVGPTLDNTIGAIFIGVVGASFLFGITTLQTYWYYHYYPQDSALHKFSVAVLWALDAFHLILSMVTVYHYNVTGFGNILSLLKIDWSIKLQVSLNVIVILIVHSLYALRVWRLGGYHHGILGYVVASIVAGGAVIGTVLAVEIYFYDSFLKLDNISWAINSSLATATGIDFVIAAAMCFYLRKSKGKESRLNSRISVIMQYTLSSGVMTSACSLSAMFSYILLPRTYVFLGIEFLLTKFYVLSFLAMLNARQRARGSDTFEEMTSNVSQHQLKVGVTSSFCSPSDAAMDTDIEGRPTREVPPWQSWDVDLPRPVVL